MTIIIPAAGIASRFGGVRKELLPLSDAPGDCALRRQVWRGLAVGRVRVVTSTANAPAHAAALADMPVDLRVRSTGADDMWRTVLAGIDGAGGLLLADTVWSGALPSAAVAPIVFGVFETDEPERYSVIRDGRIVTKQHGPPALAWGCVLWQAETAAWWQETAFPSYDEAFEAAMDAGWATFPIRDYHDLGSFNAYRRWLP